MQNRKRATQLIVRVTPEEKDHIYKKMELYGSSNFNTYARKMLIDGYVVKVDTAHFQELAHEVNKIGTNINQLTRIANTTAPNPQHQNAKIKGVNPCKIVNEQHN